MMHQAPSDSPTLNPLREGSPAAASSRVPERGDFDFESIPGNETGETTRRAAARRWRASCAEEGPLRHPFPSPQENPDSSRPRLLALAYRMLGSVADAEDAVQEAYLRLQQSTGIDNPQAWLVKVTTTICVDQLRRQRRRRQDYWGPWLPEPVSDRGPGGNADPDQLADSLSMAFLLLLETLSPAERAAYLLREAFNYEFEEISQLLEKTPTTVRQLVSRARGRLARQERRFHPQPEQVERLADEFFAACRTGDLQQIETQLAADVVMFSDGGGIVHASPRPIGGAARVARLLSVIFRKFYAEAQIDRVLVNGQPGIALSHAGSLIGVLSFAASERQIEQLYFVLNPEKLEHWRTAADSTDSL